MISAADAVLAAISARLRDGQPLDAEAISEIALRAVAAEMGLEMLVEQPAAPVAKGEEK